MRHASSHRQRWGLELAQCTTPITLGLVLYILRAQLSLQVSLAKCQWCSTVLQVEPLAPAICYPCRRLSPHPDAPNPGVMACHSLRRGHRRTLLYLPENLISGMQKPDLTCQQRESNPRRRASQPGPLHCSSASVLARWATRAGLISTLNSTDFDGQSQFVVVIVLVCSRQYYSHKHIHTHTHTHTHTHMVAHMVQRDCCWLLTCWTSHTVICAIRLLPGTADNLHSRLNVSDYQRL